jgi:peptide/nickel transport system substrate-binding protein
MDDPRVERLFRQARLGQLSRRRLLSAGLRLGLATPVLTALVMSAPMTAAAAPASGSPGNLSRGQGTSSGTLTVLRDGNIPDLDPQYAYDNAASMLFLPIYDMLVRYKDDRTDEIEPMLASGWEEAPDGLSVTFTIPEGITFHDGTPVDAQLVKDSFTRFLLQGAGPVNVISRFIDTPYKMEVVSPTELKFSFEQPQPLFLPAMASEYGPFIVNTTLVEANKTDDDPWAHEFFRENAIGTGPYKMTENSPNEHIILQKFDEYRGGWEGNHFDEIVVRIVPELSTRRQLLETGEADLETQSLTSDDYDALKANPDVEVIGYPSTAIYWTIMNAPRLLSPAARQGMSYAFPYDDIVNAVFKGFIKRSGPIASTVQGADPDVFLYPTDLAKAKELILSAGFKEGDTFDYAYIGDVLNDATIAQLFQANLQQIGFNLELVTWERGQFIDMLYGDSPAEERPMFMGGWSWWPDYNDPWNQLAPNFLAASSGGGGSNAGYFVNDRFEEIMAQVEVYTDQNEMLTLMKEAQNILTEQDPPVLYYGEPIWTTTIRKDVKGFVPNPLYLGSYNVYDMYREG